MYQYAVVWCESATLRASFQDNRRTAILHTMATAIVSKQFYCVDFSVYIRDICVTYKYICKI
jgi:hypothetical protein